MSERILITGSSGTVGGFMIPALVNAGYSVTAFDSRVTGDVVADRIVEGDGRDEDAVREALRDATQVIHLAGIASPEHPSPIELFTTNTALTFTLLTLASEAGVRKVAIASSVQIIGYLLNEHGAMPPYYPIDEQTPRAIEHAYPLAKLADEATLRMVCARTGMAGLAMRFPLIGSEETLRQAALAAADDPRTTMCLGAGYLTPGDVARLAECVASSEFDGFHVVGISGPRTFAPAPTRELIARWAPDADVRAALPGFAAPIDTSAARELLGFDPQGFIEFESQRGLG